MLLETFVALIVGILLRFGIPLGLTLLLAWLLRKLDLRWLEEVRRQRASMSSLGAAVRQVRCWETRRCNPERHATCEAFLQPEIPCWQHFRKDQGQLKEECLGCEVFQEAFA
jgi:hypothetical protein